jgi:hypothetical protein
MDSYILKMRKKLEKTEGEGYRQKPERTDIQEVCLGLKLEGPNGTRLFYIGISN